MGVFATECSELYEVGGNIGKGMILPIDLFMGFLCVDNFRYFKYHSSPIIKCVYKLLLHVKMWSKRDDKIYLTLIMAVIQFFPYGKWINAILRVGKTP